MCVYLYACVCACHVWCYLIKGSKPLEMVCWKYKRHTAKHTDSIAWTDLKLTNSNCAVIFLLLLWSISWQKGLEKPEIVLHTYTHIRTHTQDASNKKLLLLFTKSFLSLCLSFGCCTASKCIAFVHFNLEKTMTPKSIRSVIHIWYNDDLQTLKQCACSCVHVCVNAWLYCCANLTEKAVNEQKIAWWLLCLPLW